MADERGSLDPTGQAIEARIEALEARVDELTAEVAALAHIDQLTAEVAALRASEGAGSGERPGAMPHAPLPPAAGLRPPVGYETQPLMPPIQAGPPPMPVGWAAYAPQPKATAIRRRPVEPAPEAGDLLSPQASPPGSPPRTPPEPRSWSFNDLEQRLTGRLLAWVGGAAVLLGAIFFLSLAFSRGWIGPEGRVVIALVAGMALFGLGTWLFENGRQAVVATALVGVGLGVGSLGLIGATRLYDIVPVELGMLGSLILAIATAVVSVRADSRTVAAFGLLAVLAAPPLQGAGPSLATIGLIATVLVGTTAISLQRAWSRIPVLAFVLSAPQLASWILDYSTPAGPAMVVLATFWFINTVAAGGEEFVRPTARLRTSAATLLLTNSAYTVAGGFVLLDGSLEPWRGTFLIALALAHAVLAGLVIGRRGDRDAFGMLVAATGIVAATIAVPVQFGGPTVPLAWSAEAVALGWLAARRDHAQAAVGAVGLGALAVAHFGWFEYPVRQFGTTIASNVPFVDPAGLTLAFLLGAIVVAGLLIPRPYVRLALVAGAILLVAYALPFELAGLALLAGWTALAVLAVAADRIALGLWPTGGAYPRFAIDPKLAPGWLSVTSLAPAALALAQALSNNLPMVDIGHVIVPAVPFADAHAAAAAILIAGCLGAGLLAGGRPAIRAAALAAGVVAAYSLPFELVDAWMVVGWSALVALGIGLVSLDQDGRVPARAFAIGLLAVGAAVALTTVAPPTRLFVEGRASADPLSSYAALAALVAAAAYGIRARVIGYEPWPAGVAGAFAVYLGSVVIVDAFRAQVGGSITTVELARQAQVALSVSWTFVGVVSLALGLARHVGPARIFGLGLLALATAKVFLFDLASLDVTYRVMSLVGLGLLLLLSAYLYQRMRPAPTGHA